MKRPVYFRQSKQQSVRLY